ncbi:helicase-related protein [Methylomonas koyamae]|uniref:helicase-related protein n=1 Tax=Methylomonas koyamae TaxID=702114 RepID=UPI0007C99539|nr:SNF2-related protein [Methylomonas koyamae]
MTWENGVQVRLSYNPGRIGVCTGVIRQTGPITRVQVRFPDATSEYLPEDDLEICDQSDNDDPYELISRGMYGRASDLRRNLTYAHLSGRLANLLYSMGITDTDFYPHQYKPLLTLLDSPANGILIADEVGLGKTIEAGLIWTELRARFDMRRLLVVCPAMLREKWKDELQRRFGIAAEILDAKLLKEYLEKPRASSGDGQAWIVSYQTTRPPKEWQAGKPSLAQRPNPRWLLADLLNDSAGLEPLLDMVVFDEAHYMRNPESAVNKLGGLMREISDYVVLLSATPINLHNEELFNLLRLVDPEHFRYRSEFQYMLEANQPLVKARDAALNPKACAADVVGLLQTAAGIPILKQSRQLEALLTNPPSDEDMANHAYRIGLANTLERLNLLGGAITRTRKREVQAKRAQREVKREAVPMNEVEELLYRTVTDLTRTFAWQRNISDGFLLVTPQRQVASCPAAAARAWIKKDDSWLTDLKNEYDLDDDEWQDSLSLTNYLRANLPEEITAEALEANDSKFERLKRVLKKFFKDEPDHKVVIFSTYRQTAAYLADRLNKDGINSLLLWGNMNRPKQEIIDEFRERPAIRVLMSTEVAAEGVDLQFSKVLINYDLPWNPMRVEQRIGRIDRLGQTADLIHIWNLYFANSIDDRIVSRLHDRLRIFEDALGEPEPVVGEIISKLESKLLIRKLTELEENEQIEAAFLALENLRLQQEELEKSASQMIAHGGMLLEKISAAQELSRRITEEDLLVYVRDYLNHQAPGHRFEQDPGNLNKVIIQLPPRLASELEVYLRQKGLLGQTHLATGDSRECLFLNRVAGGSSKQVERIHQFHPLIRFISVALKEGNAHFYPVVSLLLEQGPDAPNIKSGHYIFCVKKWSFEGVKQEELLASVAYNWDDQILLDEDDSDRLINFARLHGLDWLDYSSVTDPSEIEKHLGTLESRLDKSFKETVTRKQLENSDRAMFQLFSLEKHFARNKETLERVYETHIQLGRSGLAKATKGKIEALQRRVEVQRERIKQREKVVPSSHFVCAGILKVKNQGG